ncbi:MAG: hypothetical protein SPD86_08850 [Prevotella sp.]|nr:hypothetical protein [Prevotella sp.]
MKKLFVAALLAVTATSAFAQDIKSVLKAKDYAEAQSGLNSCLSSLNDEDKAKGYNKLVDLSFDKFNKENAVAIEAQTLEQMGQKSNKTYDKQGMYDALLNGLNNALECDKYDQLPNAKGKVAPKFRKKNADRIWPNRIQFVIAGQDGLQGDDQTVAYKYFAAYVDSYTAPLFADVDKGARDEYLGSVALIAARLAYQMKDMDKANQYCDVALNDTASYKEALGVKVAFMQQAMKTKEDSLRCLKDVEALYLKDKANENIFSVLAPLYGALGMQDKQDAILAERLAANPNDFMANLVKGQALMNASKWDEAIASLQKATAAKDDALALTFLGFCYNNKAAQQQDVAAMKGLFEKAKECFEKARDIDPNQQRASWSYMLDNTNYNLERLNGGK